MEVSQQVIEVLDFIGQKIGVAFDWTQSNIIPQIQTLMSKIVAYELWTSVVWLFIGGAMMSALPIIWKKYRKIVNGRDKDCDEEMMFLIFWIISIFAFIIGALIVSCQLFDIVECLTFPEKVVYEFIVPYLPN